MDKLRILKGLHMDNTKIGNKEAIALLVTITFNNIIMNITKTIISTTASASLLNILYVGIIAIIFTCIICYFLNKFPTFDLIDISKYLGGNVLKWIIGLLYIGYFIFFAGILLHMFASCLQIIYFPLTKIFYIILLFILAGLVTCNMKYNAIYRSTLIIFPFIIISTLFLFFSDIPFFQLEKMYPVFGNGLFTTFVSGLCNLFAFQGLAYIYFMPPMLKEPTKVKNIAVTSIVLSCIVLLICLAIILFMFNGFVETDELLPLYSAVKYIEFGSFFRKMDSIFVLILITSFVSYLSIALKFSTNILKKLTNFKNSSLLSFLLSIVLLCASIWPKNYAISTYFASDVYKYTFLILIIGISFLILLSATVKQKVRKWFKK